MIRTVLAVVGASMLLAAGAAWFLVQPLRQPGAWFTPAQTTGSWGT